MCRDPGTSDTRKREGATEVQASHEIFLPSAIVNNADQTKLHDGVSSLDESRVETCSMFRR